MFISYRFWPRLSPAIRHIKFIYLARLSPDLEAEPVHHRLDLPGRPWMFFCIMEYHRQNEGTGLRLQGQPCMGQHHPGPAVYLDHVVVVVQQLLCLGAGADGNGLVRIDLIERFAHMGMLPYPGR